MTSILKRHTIVIVKGVIPLQEHNFSGFSSDTIDFLNELRFNNNKEWMEENRQRYKTVLKEPMDNFAYIMNKELMTINKELNTIPVVSRINRDIRFSKNKAPYKDCKWVVFKSISDKQWQDRPVYFFELGPNGYNYGMGFYESKPKFMQNFRKKVDANTAEFETLIKNLKHQGSFTLDGEFYKRKLADDKSEEVMNWYQRKSLALITQKPLEEAVFSYKLIDNLKKEFKIIYPIYQYLMSVPTE